MFRFSGGLLWLAFFVLYCLFFEEAKDVVENKVAVRLLGEEESLNKFPPRLTTVRHFTNNLNDDATVGRGLSVDRVNEDLAVFKPNRGDLVVYFLVEKFRLVEKRSLNNETDLLTVTGSAIFAFSTVNERRCFVVETVETMG